MTTLNQNQLTWRGRFQTGRHWPPAGTPPFEQLQHFILLFHNNSLGDASQFFGVSSRTLYRWLRGDTKIPDLVLTCIDLKFAQTSSDGFKELGWSYCPTGVVKTPYGSLRPNEIETIPLMRRSIESHKSANEQLKKRLRRYGVTKI